MFKIATTGAMCRSVIKFSHGFGGGRKYTASVRYHRTATQLATKDERKFNGETYKLCNINETIADKEPQAPTFEVFVHSTHTMRALCAQRAFFQGETIQAMLHPHNPMFHPSSTSQATQCPKLQP